MKLEALTLRNFKAFRHAEMRNIPEMCVIVGANGTGKSTIFKVFGFLRDALTEDVHTALVKLGGSKGFKEARSRNTSGPIVIELKYRVDTDQPLATYRLEIDELHGAPVVAREVLAFTRGTQGKPFHFIDFKNGKGKAIAADPSRVKSFRDLEREPQELKSADTLAIRGLAQFKKFPAAVALGELISDWHLSDISIDRARPEQEAGLSEHLSTRGENLSLVLEFLKKRHPSVLASILKQMGQRIPGLKRVDSKETEEGRVLLRFQDGAFADPFLARHVSDGTIKMLAYLVLLHDPKPHPLLCIEEPENQLYPTLLEELAEEFRDYSRRGGQVFISTHSPDFLNACTLDEVFWIIKQDGYSTIQRASDNAQVKRYMQNDDKMGYLWKQGFFDGVDPR